MIETLNKSILDPTKFLTQQVLLSFFQIYQSIPIKVIEIGQVFNYKSILVLYQTHMECP